MENEKIKLNGIPETMLQTLWARAQGSKNKNHIIYDEKAIEIINKIDYDFKDAQSDSLMKNGVIARTYLLDKMVNEFLKDNRDTTVINIACGLDTRCYRVKGNFRAWYNLDLPQTMDIRRKILDENKPIYDIALSAADEAWPKEVKARGEKTLVIIEGLTMYLDEDTVKKIFEIINKNFKNAAVFVETMNPAVVKSVKEKSIEKSARFTWGIKNGKELQKIIPEFDFKEERSLAEGMAEIFSIYKILKKIKFVREISNKIIVMEN